MSAKKIKGLDIFGPGTKPKDIIVPRDERLERRPKTLAQMKAIDKEIEDEIYVDPKILDIRITI